MLVGFALFKRLRVEWECLEVYPQATMRMLGTNVGLYGRLGCTAITFHPQPMWEG